MSEQMKENRVYRPGLDSEEMIVFEICQGKHRSCPNLLVDPDSWRDVIYQALIVANIDERLRERITRKRALFHQKLHISISGCPNGCSRPQVADFGLTGFVRPRMNTKDCNECGACEAECPDRAVRLYDGPPTFDRSLCLGCNHCVNACPQGCFTYIFTGARLYIGGRLGRRPRFAKLVSELDTPETAARKILAQVERFLERAKPGVRFADFFFRKRFH
jgi:anaerobic sulfite reductase subunit C